MTDELLHLEEDRNRRDERPNYLGLFEERLEKLAPLPEHRTIEIAEKFGLDKIGLYPVKFVACVLYAPPRNADLEILVPDVVEYERYKQKDHIRILREFGVPWSTDSTWVGFVLCTSNEQRYLLTSRLWIVKENPKIGEEQAKLCFDRYRIKAGFNLDPPEPFENFYTLDPSEDYGIYEGSFTELVDELIKDDLFLQIAKTYGLTNTEYLRFSLTGELPEGKTSSTNRTS